MSEKPTLKTIKRGDTVQDLHGDEHKITNKLFCQLFEYELLTHKEPISGGKISGSFLYWIMNVEKRENKRVEKLKAEIADEKLISLLKTRSDEIGFKLSGRGWCYILEGEGIINKSQFKEYNTKIIEFRKDGRLPIDFIPEDETRQFDNVEKLEIKYIDPKKFFYEQIKDVKKLYNNKDDVSFWSFQKVYIQMLVEKIDLINLFRGVCEDFHIPIANAKGRTDINQRNLLALRFKKAEKLGKRLILLYYPDHDPMGLKIVDDMMNNLKQIEKSTGWNPKNLDIKRIGLTSEFIVRHNLTWIDNLITGGDRDLGDLYKKYKAGTLTKKEKIYDYEISYIEEFGPKKIEANAILKIREEARLDLYLTIFDILGAECFDEYKEELREHKKEVKDMMKSVNVRRRIIDIIRDVIELEDE